MSLDASKTYRLWLKDWLNPMDLAGFYDMGRPLDVDVGCGKGRFLLARAVANPEVNYLGIDRMLKRIRKIDNKLKRRKIENTRLLRMDAYYALAHLIPPNVVRTYFVFFPDPWPKKRHHGNRFFNEEFLNAIHRTMTPEGELHFATDHLPYYEQVKDILVKDPRFDLIDPFVPDESEQTDFERYYIQHVEIGRVSIRNQDDVAPSLTNRI